MSDTILQLKEQAEKKFMELDLPTFNFGNGFTLNLAVDWNKVFSEIQKAENPEIIADKRVRIQKQSELGEIFTTQNLVSADENKL